MIDNFDLIKNYLPETDNEDLCYHVIVLKRKKDHPDLPSKNNTYRIDYSCIVMNKEDLERKRKLLINISEIEQSRVMINICPKSLVTLLWEMQHAGLTLLQHAKTNVNRKLFRLADSCLGVIKAPRNHQLFLLDIDDKNDLDLWLERLKTANAKVELIVPTKSGYHIHCKPFNLTLLKDYKSIDIHKNNPTLLYLPKSLD